VAVADEEIRHVSDSDAGSAGESHGAAPDAGESQLAQATRIHQELAEGNQKDLAAIRQMGANVDPALFLQLRINTFIQFVLTRLGNATEEIRQLLLLEFEANFERACSEQLQFIKGEVRKASMGLGAALSPEQIRQMAKMDPGLGRPNGPGRG
jgi:hypothetical protein